MKYRAKSNFSGKMHTQKPLNYIDLMQKAVFMCDSIINPFSIFEWKIEIDYENSLLDRP